jgi:neutral trehalase
MMRTARKDFPKIHFYDQDFVDIYDKTWAWVQDCWQSSPNKDRIPGRFFSYPGSAVIRADDAVYSSFFLVYSNRIYQASPALDIFYSRQEPSGAIRGAYSLETGEAETSPDNSEGLCFPLFAWVEYNLYHKTANKKRVKEIIPVLDKWYQWLENNYRMENGLFEAPLAATSVPIDERRAAAFPIDYNAAMAINALYLSALADIMNDKDTSFAYKKRYFGLKTHINSLMWDNDDSFYYDIDKDGQKIKVKTLASFWTLLAEIPNEDKAERSLEYLTNPDYFGTEHPFASVARSESCFSEGGNGYHGSVFPHLNYMVIKGLERYQRWDMAREFAIRHIYYMLDSATPPPDEKPSRSRANTRKNSTRIYEAYLPTKEGLPSPDPVWPAERAFPRPQYLSYAALSTISLIIENIIGLNISLPKKTVEWTIPNMEVMGIENLSLKKNLITIISQRSGRGWEIHMESEKLYYFKINVVGQKKKTLPIPSGKCSMLIDKI